MSDSRAKSLFGIVNGFVHDLCTGGWFAVAGVVYYLETTRVSTEARAVLDALEHRLFWAGAVCAVLVLTTGGGRMFTYVDQVYGQEAEQQRRRALAVKHAFFLMVFGLGTWWQYRLAFG